eukprot:1155848-Pelagomonas_calceolata.AAC.3
MQVAGVCEPAAASTPGRSCNNATLRMDIKQGSAASHDHCENPRAVRIQGMVRHSESSARPAASS